LFIAFKDDAASPLFLAAERGFPAAFRVLVISRRALNPGVSSRTEDEQGRMEDEQGR
jgi:hypothetical protein